MKNITRKKKLLEYENILYSLTIVIFAFLLTFCSNKNENVLEYSGTIESRANIVSSEVPGKVEKLFFNKGDIVNKGDTLAIINHDKLKLQLEQADATIKSLKIKLRMLKNGARKEDRNLAKENLKQAEANFKLAKKNKERMTQLHKAESITRQQYDEALLAYKIAESRYNSAKQTLKKIKNPRIEQVEELEALIDKSEAGKRIIEKNINDCYIKAPISGQIVNRFVEEKELVAFLSSIYKIIDITNCELTVYVPEVDLAKIKLNDSAKIYIDAFNDKSFNGEIVFISPEAEFTPKNIQTKDERTKLVFAVKIEIKNPEMILKVGMPADAQIEI